MFHVLNNIKYPPVLRHADCNFLQLSHDFNFRQSRVVRYETLVYLYDQVRGLQEMQRRRHIRRYGGLPVFSRRGDDDLYGFY